MIIAFIGNNGTGKTTIAEEVEKLWLGKMETNAVEAREENIFELIEKENKRNKTKLLCLGCANGNFALVPSKEVGGEVDIYGIDISIKSLKEAKDKELNTILYDLNKKFLLKTNSFDVIVSDQVIEHLTNVENFIKSI